MKEIDIEIKVGKPNSIGHLSCSFTLGVDHYHISSRQAPAMFTSAASMVSIEFEPPHSPWKRLRFLLRLVWFAMFAHNLQPKTRRMRYAANQTAQGWINLRFTLFYKTNISGMFPKKSVRIQGKHCIALHHSKSWRLVACAFYSVTPSSNYIMTPHDITYVPG